ncbi:MAG: gluconokinase [Spirochaetales bacterium]|nr:gluconokinase [Spirochaetales bacterium]
MIYLVMGVSGCGKTYIGSLLAEKIGLPFYDADDFHSPANIKKMKAGIPLSDKDREPWLRAISANLTDWQKRGGAVLACSALKQKYRILLTKTAGGKMHTIYLKGSYNLILKRMKKRKHSFFSADLLESQFAVLEEPEHALTVSISHTPRDIVHKIIGELQKLADTTAT